jgi:hypothetical protein
MQCKQRVVRWHRIEGSKEDDVVGIGLKIIKIEIITTQNTKQVFRIINVVEIAVRAAFEAPVVKIDDTFRALWHCDDGDEECETANRRENKRDFKSQ